MQLSGAEVRRVAAIRDQLATVDTDHASLLRWLVREMRDVFGVARASTHGAAQTVDGLRLEFGHWSGFAGADEQTNAVMDKELRCAGHFGAYNAVRPEPKQRDRVFVFQSPRLIIEQPIDALRDRSFRAADRRAISERVRAHAQMFAALDALDLRQMRILLCDGSRLLGWLGVFDDRPFTRGQRAMLAEIAPWVRTRLRLQREIGTSASSDAAFETAFELLAAPAYLVSGRGVIVHANRCGQDALENSACGARELLRRALAGGAAPGVDIFALGGRGQRAMKIVLLRSSATTGAVRTENAVRAWRLTPREREVLQLIVTGDTNRDIALTLHCAEATVEIHVSRILRKADVHSRTALVSAYWNPR